MTAAISKDQKPKGKPRGRGFQKGQSGNPTGRPKLPDDIKHVREMAREYTIEAVQALASVMDNGSGPARVAAANALLDRGWGKAAQVVAGDDEGGPIKHSIRVVFE